MSHVAMFILHQCGQFRRRIRILSGNLAGVNTATAVTSRALSFSSSSTSGNAYLLFQNPSGKVTALLFDVTKPGTELEDVSIGFESAWAYVSTGTERQRLPTGGLSSSEYPLEDFTFTVALSTTLTQGQEHSAYSVGQASYNHGSWAGRRSLIFHLV